MQRIDQKLQFILGLAVFDTIFLVTYILNHGIPSLLEQQDLGYPIYWPVVFPISSTAYTGSMYLTILLTLERYLAVCYPQKVAGHFNPRIFNPKIQPQIFQPWTLL